MIVRSGGGDSPGHASGTLTHPAFFYRSDDDYVAGLIPFLRDGLLRGEPLAVAVPGAKLELLRSALGDDASRISLIDMANAGRNPGRIIAGVLHQFADEHPTVHVRIIGEPVWADRTDDEYAACVQHEALINLAFAGRDVTIVCPYDAARLPARALDDAQVTHPVLWDGGFEHVSGEYDWVAAHARYNQPMAEPSAADTLLIESPADVAAARTYATARGGSYGLSGSRADDLCLIVSELVTNSLVHTNGSCRLSVRAESDRVVCDVTDSGQLTDPLAGRRACEPSQIGGRGLLLVNDLADLVRIYTGLGGTTVRVMLRLDRST